MRRRLFSAALALPCVAAATLWGVGCDVTVSVSCPLPFDARLDVVTSNSRAAVAFVRGAGWSSDQLIDQDVDFGESNFAAGILRRRAREKFDSMFFGTSLGNADGPDYSEHESGDYDITRHWFGETGRLHLKWAGTHLATRSKSVYYAMVPFWLLTAVTTIPLLAMQLCKLLWTSRRESRPLRELCSVCGYSLTGNTSGVCPECGTPVPKPPACVIQVRKN
jgi:hypothetical protein